MSFEEGDIFKKALNSFKTVSYELENKFSSYFVLRDSLANRYTGLSNLLGTKLEPDTTIKKLRQLNLILFGKVHQIFFDSNNTVYLLRIFKNNPEEIIQLENLTDIFSTAIDELNSISSLNDQLKSNIQNKNKEAADNNIDAINSAHKKLITILNVSLSKVSKFQSLISEEESQTEYLNRFKEEASLLTKEYENKIINLTEKFENKIKSFELDQDKLIQSSQLLATTIDAGLKNLADLNERLQKLEVNFNNTIHEKSQQIEAELKETKTTFENQINALRNRTNVKAEKIKNSHKDFVQLVQNAGIYQLTENYSEKAREEKRQYETYRSYTSRSIGAAILFTIIILAIPLIEYWGANPPVDTGYYTIFARLTISLMFFVLAFYFSKQAAKHYECYQENHRTFLQLAALEPFMARMSEEEQKEIRKGLIPSYFNQGADDKFAAKGDEVSTLQALITPLSEIATSLKKPSKESDSS